MQITTKNIIKMLPIEANVKEKLSKDFDDMPLEKKYAIKELLWGFFYSWYGIKLEENTQLALLDAKNGKMKLDHNFYNKVKEKTDREIEEGALETVEKVDLEEARRAMEFIVKEIKASKRKSS